MGVVAAGTGHRPDKLGGYSEAVTARLVDLARAALLHYRPEKVISGMALGWDTALALAALELGIPLIAAIPFEGQEKAWPAVSQARYRDILSRATEIVIVSAGRYSGWKMQVRNEWMVDRCDILLALWDGSEGGTRNCLRYAERKGTQVSNLWVSWMRYACVPDHEEPDRPRG